MCWLQVANNKICYCIWPRGTSNKMQKMAGLIYKSLPLKINVDENWLKTGAHVYSQMLNPV